MDFYIYKTLRHSEQQADDELMHYGIIGMKWGVRRYQNADGSYTTAGKAHYASKKEMRKDIRKENKKAFELGRDATIKGRAAIYATNNFARKDDKLNKALEKDPTGLGKRAQKAQSNYWKASATALVIAGQEQDAMQKAIGHRKELAEKFGEEHVSQLRMSTKKLSSSAAAKIGSRTIKVADEKVADAKEVAAAAGLTAVVNAVSIATKIPVRYIAVPAGKNSRGRAYYQSVKDVSNAVVKTKRPN